ncbi:ATP-binding cassette domain-containing protein [Candidatus Methanoperedens nitratireducens]|uniref:ABC-type multidrug transport system, ATPase component n=1 Tax=Candidatus Methanoperedens nitratireducens TaxID=1392998 RepID=A0A284VIM6_9EURY
MRKHFDILPKHINESSVLFLDDPTSGIYTLGAQMMRDLIKKLSKEKGVTVFLSSYSMAEVEEIYDRIGVIARGKLLAVGTMEELRNKLRDDYSTFIFAIEYILVCQNYDLCNKTHWLLETFSGMKITQNGDTNLLLLILIGDLLLQSAL